MSELAKVDDTSIDGAVYEDKNGTRFVEVASNGDAQRLTSLRRRLIDLPDVPQRMNAISAVLSYELFGLSQHDIAVAVGLDNEQVGRIMMLDAYRDMREAVVKSIAEREQDEVRDIFVQKAKRSATRIVELAESARPDIALSASREVLDRSGNTVKEIVEHRHRLDGGLTIEYIKRDNSQQAPTIDVSYKDVSEDAKQDSQPSSSDGDVQQRKGSKARKGTRNKVPRAKRS